LAHATTIVVFFLSVHRPRLFDAAKESSKKCAAKV
jgi:hypothetical protein